MNIAAAQWLQDLEQGLLYLEELYEQQELKDFHWFLDRAVKVPWEKRKKQLVAEGQSFGLGRFLTGNKPASP